jgi:hypothetical protein
VTDFVWDLVLVVLASPVLMVEWLVRAIRRWRFSRLSYTPRIICRNCGEAISLVGIWRCGCGYTYRGHLLRKCLVCRSLPRMVRCHQCGVTEKLPEP